MNTVIRRRLYSTHQSLAQLIRSTIKSTGPISYAAYMNLCLAHPTLGYYTRSREHSLLGRKGDFVTSPEISQVFGELIAVWLIKQWMDTAPSKKIRIIELGPGKGTLMSDMLRVFSTLIKDTRMLSHIHLVEVSEPMRNLQRQSLSSYTSKTSWWSTLDEVPQSDEDTYTMLVAHEFFDALPIHVLQNTESGWREVLIAQGKEDDRLVASLSTAPTSASHILSSTTPRFKAMKRVEVSPVSARVARLIADRLRPSGCALVIDYGNDHAFGDSFRAFKDHKLVDDPLLNPGECDLTANVDFTYLKEALGTSIQSHGVLSQADFLHRMGLESRVNALTKSTVDQTKIDRIKTSADRLISRTGMGREYKFMAITTSKEHQVWPFMNVQY